MPNTRLHDRGNRSHLAAGQGLKNIAPSSGIAEKAWTGAASGSSVDLSSVLSQFKEVHELGRPLLVQVTSADLSAVSTITVPAGKYWRIIGGLLQYLASADVATRTPIVTLRDTAALDVTTYDTFTLSTKTADQDEEDTFIAGSDGNVGTPATASTAVAAVGKLTIAEPVTAGDDFTIGANTYTFVAGTANSEFDIDMGASEAATKLAIAAKFADDHHPLVHCEAAFTGDDLLFTARNPGTAGDAIVFVEVTLTHGSNVLDGSGTLGGTTAGVDPATKIGTAGVDFPDGGPLLGPAERILLTTTNGHANDAATLYVFGIEYDHNPSS